MRWFDAERFLKNKYNHLLIALIALFILSPSLEVREHKQFPLIPLIVLVVLVTAVRAHFPRGPFFNSFLTVAFVSFAINLVIYFLPKSQAEIGSLLVFFSRGINVIFYLVTIYLLSRQLFRVRQVTADTIKGGVSAYLLIGFTWATLYGLLMQVNPEAFVLSSQTEMMLVHFSFTTLTTLGYGDIVPHTRFAAILTNSEAIIGQLFLTIFVARLVGLYIVGEQQAPRE